MSKALSYKDQFQKDLLDRLAKKGIYYRPVRSRSPVRRVRNSYQAGIIDRLTASFSTSSLSADREIHTALKAMRARSRNVSVNNVYGKRFIDSLPINVIGREGITLQNQARDDNGAFDVDANKAIEEHWRKWSAEGVCDVTGDLSLHEALCLGLKSAGRDGEFFIRMIRGWKRNNYRFAIQLIEADMLDENYYRDLPNGNRIIMGVERDEWGRRVNYHFLTRHPGDYSYQGMRYNVVPASEILHVFITDRIGQSRGVPWMYAAMIWLNHLGAYTEAAIINARIGASKMGFYKLAGDGDLSAVADDTDDEGEFIMEAEPGIFGKLPKGWEFQEFNPQYPSAEYEPFNKVMLRGIGVGLNMAYSSVSGDLSDVNFSSIRSGKIDERDAHKFIQSWYINKTVAKMFPVWLETSLMVEAVKMAGGRVLPYQKFDKFNAPRWQARGWDWVDPKKDIEADIAAINFGLKTRADVAAERGMDLREIFEQLAEEKKLAGEYGLKFNVGKTEAALKKPDEDKDQEDEGDDE